MPTKRRSNIAPGFAVLDVLATGRVRAIKSVAEYQKARRAGRQPLVLHTAAPVDALPGLLDELGVNAPEVTL